MALACSQICTVNHNLGQLPHDILVWGSLFISSQRAFPLLQGQAIPPPGLPTFSLSQGSKQLLALCKRCAHTPDEADGPADSQGGGQGAQTPEPKPNSGSRRLQAWRHHRNPRAGRPCGFFSDLLKKRFLSLPPTPALTPH